MSVTPETNYKDHYKAQPGFLKRVQARIIDAASPKAIVIAAGLYLASLAALTAADAPLKQAAPGLSKPDLTFAYTYADIIQILSAYWAAGRQAYLTNLIVDSIMPVCFAAVTLLVAARAAPRWLGLLGIAPLVFMIVDLIENPLLAVMVSQFPDVSPALVSFTSPLTMIKLSAFAVAMPTLIIGVLYLIISWLIRRR
jgi:hypothetical protein